MTFFIHRTWFKWTSNDKDGATPPNICRVQISHGPKPTWIISRVTIFKWLIESGVEDLDSIITWRHRRIHDPQLMELLSLQCFWNKCSTKCCIYYMGDMVMINQIDDKFFVCVFAQNFGIWQTSVFPRNLAFTCQIVAWICESSQERKLAFHLENCCIAWETVRSLAKLLLPFVSFCIPRDTLHSLTNLWLFDL